jgi:hypothetical protein
MSEKLKEDDGPSSEKTKRRARELINDKALVEWNRVDPKADPQEEIDGLEIMNDDLTVELRRLQREREGLARELGVTDPQTNLEVAAQWTIAAHRQAMAEIQSLRETALTASESRHATVRIKTANGDAYDCLICSRIFAKLRRISATPDTREESEKERGE